MKTKQKARIIEKLDNQSSHILTLALLQTNHVICHCKVPKSIKVVHMILACVIPSLLNSYILYENRPKFKSLFTK